MEEGEGASVQLTRWAEQASKGVYGSLHAGGHTEQSSFLLAEIMSLCLASVTCYKQQT